MFYQLTFISENRQNEELSIYVLTFLRLLLFVLTYNIYFICYIQIFFKFRQVYNLKKKTRSLTNSFHYIKNKGT